MTFFFFCAKERSSVVLVGGWRGFALPPPLFSLPHERTLQRATHTLSLTDRTRTFTEPLALVNDRRAYRHATLFSLLGGAAFHETKPLVVVVADPLSLSRARGAANPMIVLARPGAPPAGRARRSGLASARSRVLLRLPRTRLLLSSGASRAFSIIITPSRRCCRRPARAAPFPRSCPGMALAVHHPAAASGRNKGALLAAGRARVRQKPLQLLPNETLTLGGRHSKMMCVRAPSSTIPRQQPPQAPPPPPPLLRAPRPPRPRPRC